MSDEDVEENEEEEEEEEEDNEEETDQCTCGKKHEPIPAKNASKLSDAISNMEPLLSSNNLNNNTSSFKNSKQISLPIQQQQAQKEIEINVNPNKIYSRKEVITTYKEETKTNTHLTEEIHQTTYLDANSKAGTSSSSFKAKASSPINNLSQQQVSQVSILPQSLKSTTSSTTTTTLTSSINLLDTNNQEKELEVNQVEEEEEENDNDDEGKKKLEINIFRPLTTKTSNPINNNKYPVTKSNKLEELMSFSLSSSMSTSTQSFLNDLNPSSTSSESTTLYSFITQSSSESSCLFSSGSSLSLSSTLSNLDKKLINKRYRKKKKTKEYLIGSKNKTKTSTTISSIQLDRKKKVIEKKVYKFKSLPRMSKFIEFVDIKRLPAVNSYSYQDDTIDIKQQDPVACSYGSTAISDLRKIVNKFDLSLGARIITSGSTPCAKNKVDYESPTTRILRLSNDNTPVEDEHEEKDRGYFLVESGELLRQSPIFQYIDERDYGTRMREDDSTNF